MTIESNSLGARLSDIVGIGVLATVTAGFYLFRDQIGALNLAYPYSMAFLTFGFLSTYGEALSGRVMGGGWLPAKLVWRALIWGVFGVWISAAFPFTAGGVHALIGGDLWPARFAAFSTSAWANFFSGFGFFMMLTHYWVSAVLIRGWVWPWEIFGEPELRNWAKTIIPSLFIFWVPAHTITFLLPPDWRVLFAAYLGISLGLILTFARRPSKSVGAA
jgi:hypothetical protein